MNNIIIRQNLVRKREQCLSFLESRLNLDHFLKEILRNLGKFNFEEYKKDLEIEILKNLRNWWSNPEKGIKKEEELYAILFEYDYFFQKNVEAAAYGIGEWKDFQVQQDKFDMGFDYDFTTNFYACPGIGLQFFDSLERLDYENLPEKYKTDHINYDDLKDGDIIEMDQIHDIEFVEGYHELIELHKLEGMIAIHDVLLKIESDNGFESLNHKNNLMFLINEHDSGEVYPLLIKNN